MCYVPEVGQSRCFASHKKVSSLCSQVKTGNSRVNSKALNFEFGVLNKSLHSSVKFTQITHFYLFLKIKLRQEDGLTYFFMVCSLTWLDVVVWLGMKYVHVSWFMQWREIKWFMVHFLNKIHLNFNCFSSQKAQVQVKSWVIGVNVQVDMAKSSPKSSNLWPESDLSTSHVIQVHTPLLRLSICHNYWYRGRRDTKEKK